MVYHIDLSLTSCFLLEQLGDGLLNDSPVVNRNGWMDIGAAVVSVMMFKRFRNGCQVGNGLGVFG